MTPSPAHGRERVCILGATGSVGTSTLDVIARHPDRFEVFALSAHSRIDDLFAQCLRWKPRFAAIPDRALARAPRARGKRPRSTEHDAPTSGGTSSTWTLLSPAS